MNLTLSQIQSITRGASVVENGGEFSFDRFTNKEREAYQNTIDNDFRRQLYSSAGVCLCFKTNSKTLSFDYSLKNGSYRTFYGFDIYENGVMISHFGGDCDHEVSGHADIAFTTDTEKKIEIHLPWSKIVTLSEMTLDDGASFTPAPPRQKKLLCYGDSITQGYDAKHPSLSYAMQLGEALDAEVHNKALGSNMFFPETVVHSDMTADIVTVSLGTNDWCNCKKDEYLKNARAYYERICSLYPNAEIFAVTPIWREDIARPTEYGEAFDTLDSTIRSLLSDLPVTVIDGRELVAHRVDFYADRSLHPNDLGFCVYAKALEQKIKAIL